MNWQLLTAISVVGLSVSVLLQRVLLAKDKVDAIGYVIIFQALVGILTGVAAVAQGFVWPDLSQHWLWLAAVGCTVLYAAGHIVYAKTLQLVEASVFGVLYATHAVWITILGILFFGEHLHPLQIAGAALLFASIIVLVKQPRDFKFDRGTMLGLLTGLLFGGAITLWGYVGRHVTDPLSWSALSFIAPALLVWAVYPKATGKLRPLLAGRLFRRLLLLAAFYAIGCGAMLFAYKYGTFSVVSQLRQSGVVVTVVLALAFLPAERINIRRKLLATAICFIGILCLV